jgi:aspartate carbamoyltransferase catalytic subunit
MAAINLTAELKKARNGQDLSVLDITSIDDLTLDDVELIFRVAAVFKRHVQSGAGNKKTDILKGTSIFNFFNENSTRTRSSFELAGKHLGSDVINISGSASSGKKGETLGDTARTLDAYNADLLIVRDYHAGVPAQLATLIGAPVLNAGDGRHEHPTQALLEAFTLREKFGKKKLTYLFVGDAKHSRVFGSQVRLYRKFGWELRLASFATLVPEKIENWGIKVFYQLEDAALQSVDAIHAIRLQTERAAGSDVPTPREYSKNFMLNPRRMALANKDAVALHAGPVIREFDIGTPVLEGPQSLVQQMVENGLPIRMALEWLLITAKKKKINPWKKCNFQATISNF